MSTLCPWDVPETPTPQACTAAARRSEEHKAEREFMTRPLEAPTSAKPPAKPPGADIVMTLAPCATPGAGADDDTRYWPGLHPGLPPGWPEAAHLWHHLSEPGVWAAYCGVRVAVEPGQVTAAATRCETCLECPADRRRSR